MGFPKQEVAVVLLTIFSLACQSIPVRNMKNFESKDDPNTGIHIGNVGRDFKVQGDIVAGNKVVIQRIIRQAAEKIITAPYKFLSSYDISDRFIFFGRTAAVEELAGQIPRHKVLIINGQSGSGKTSLIRAGLIPRLADNGYFYVTFRDYSDPIRQLREYFTRDEAFRLNGADSLTLFKILWAISHKQKSRLVVVLDQFERFFVNVPPGLRRRFIQEFKECMESDLSAEEMNFVFSIRQDFFGQLVREFEAVLPRFFNESSRYHLEPLNREEAREAIVDPLRYIPNIGYNLKFVDEILLPGLIEKIADEEKIEPPHLQIVCNRLYEAAKKNLKKSKIVEIDHELYKELGGAQGILQDYLDHCVEEIVQGPKKSNVVRSILKLMIETTGTRRFISLKDIRNGLPDIKDFKLIETFIKRLENVRVIEIRGEGEATSYSLSHDFMVEKIQEWLDDREMNRKRAQETLKRGIAEWKSNKTLFSKKQIHIIHKWAVKLSEEEKKLLKESQKAYRRRSLCISGLVVLLLITSGMFLRHYSQKQKISTSRKLAAFATQILDTDPSLSFRLAEAALNIWPTFSAQKAVMSPLEYPLHNVLEGHADDVNIAGFSPDGRRIVTASHDKTARIWNVADGRQLHVLKGHMASISKVSFSSNGKYIVTASFDKTARIWDASTGQQLQILEGHTDFISHAGFSPNGTQIITASWDKTANIWDASTGRQLHVLVGHTDSVSSAKFSPNGERIITTSGDNTVRIWDATTKRQINILKGHTASIITAVFSSDGRHIVTASHDNTARIWDAATGEQVYVLNGHTAPVMIAAFSPDDRLIISASKDNTARVWDVATGRQVYTLKGHTAPVIFAEFSMDGNQILTASGDNTARTWDVESGQKRHTLNGHTAPITSAAFSPDGRQIVTASKDNSARLWNTAAGQQLYVLKEHTDSLSANMFSQNGKCIVTGSHDETARLWDIVTGEQCHILKGHGDSILSTEFSPDGERVVTASRDKTARIWHAATGQQIHVLDGHTDSVMNAAFSPDGKQIVTASKDNSARIWDVATGQERCIMDEHKGPVISAMFSPNGRQIATISLDEVRIWDTDTCKKNRTLDGDKGHFSMAVFSPNGKQVITTSEEDANVRIWDLMSGRAIHILKGHKDLVMNATFSPDGKRIITASWDNTARIWKVASGEQIHVLSGHTDIINSAMFSSDGKRVLTASEDKTARIWDAATGEQIHVLKGHREGLDSAVFSPDGKRIITASKDKTVRIWPGNYQEVLRYVNEDKFRGKVRDLTKGEKIKYGILKVKKRRFEE
jgi:WD40 repeat protein